MDCSDSYPEVILPLVAAQVADNIGMIALLQHLDLSPNLLVSFFLQFEFTEYD